MPTPVLFLDSAIAKWTLGGEGVDGGWTLIEKIPVHYNIGHLTAAEGDTRQPRGNFVVAINKWSIDRFAPVGPLHPQNFQLIDITGEKMQLLYDMPIGIGEPHYAQMIRADKLQPWVTYPEVGSTRFTMQKIEGAPEPGKEGVMRQGNKVTST